MLFTKEALLKAKIDLYNITSNLAYEDYYKANFYSNGKRKSKKYIPYSLSEETEEALEMYKMIYGKNPETITQEQEEKIKAFLIEYRTCKTKYLEDRGGQEYYKNGYNS